MKTKISVKNRTVTWTGDKPELLKALEAVGFEPDNTGPMAVARCALKPMDYDDLGEWLGLVQNAGVEVLLQLWEGKWKVEISGLEGAKEHGDIHRAIDAAYRFWWRAGRMVGGAGSDCPLEDLVEKYG